MLSECPQYANSVEAMDSAEDRVGQPYSASTTPAQWAALVERIQSGDASAMQDLYEAFGRGIRFYLFRQLGPQELDDKVHDAFLIVVQAIQRGELREPERLMGFVRTVVRRQVAAHIDRVVHSRRDEIPLEPATVVADTAYTPEESAIDSEKLELMVSVLGTMGHRDREVLTRFYLKEQSQEQICRDMNLTDTQFRLLKSRAKARFGDLGRRRLEKRDGGKTFLRNLFSGQH